MNPRPGRTRLSRNARGGFSLVELLLVVALLALLLGAVVFNFSTVQRGAALEEGASQLESLLRFARAHAASSGHKVLITFEEDAGDGLLVPLGNVGVVWEPDPLGQPDQFQPLDEAATYVRSIVDLITIENVLPVVRAATTPLTASAAGEGAAPEPATPDPASAANTGAAAFGFAPIVFYPDGSSDSAEITIAARSDEGDARRMVLRMTGLTGSIRRRVVAGESPLSAPEPSDAHTSPSASSGSVGAAKAEVAP